MAKRDWWTDWNLTVNDSVFGPLYGGQSVQEAIYNTIQKWLPTYIAEFNRSIGSTVLVEPFEYRHRPDFRTLPRQAAAAILVETPSTSGKPQVYQDSIRANWRAEVIIYVYGTKDWQETQALTSAYTTCVRTCLIQNRGLEGLAETTMWEGEEYVEGEHSSGRTTGVSRIILTVTIGNAMNMYGGFPTPQYAATGAVLGPNTEAPDPAPVVVTTDVEVEKEPNA